MKIKDLLQNVKFEINDRKILEKDVLDITCQSQLVTQGSLFVAIKGETEDGHNFAGEALGKGAVACVVDGKWQGQFPRKSALIRVENTRLIFSLLSSRFFGQPSKEIELIGITGTNGKTTTAFLVEHVFNHFASCGLIGTVHYKMGSQIIPSKNTTPSAYDINWMLTQMKKLGMRYCSMEVSSHALVQERVTHLFFKSAVFTNLTQDHLDYHKNFDAYFEAKKKLFSKTPRPSQSFINADDHYGSNLLESLYPRPQSFGIRNSADLSARSIRISLSGIAFDILVGNKTVPVQVNIPCFYNVYNVLAAFSCAVGEGWDPFEVARVLKTFPGVPGRMERVDCGQDFFVFVDYAHTPDAFEKVLSSVRALAKRKVITVCGCGGDRDRTKRPIMGRIASFLSDTVILTSDNPRSEDPEGIIDEIEGGIIQDTDKGVFRISDRGEAIAKGLTIAERDDVVLILGKGHESYQIVGSRKLAFDDRLSAEKILLENRHVSVE